MNRVQVKNQAEFDAAVAAGHDIEIVAGGEYTHKSGHARVFVLSALASLAIIRCEGSATLRIETTVEARGSSSVVAWNSSRVEARGSSSVVAWGSCVPTSDSASSILLENRNDLRRVLASAPNEAHGLLAALVAGKVDGSCYEGECCCLVGTLEKVRGCGAEGVVPRDADRPAEQLFMPILPGHTPLNSPLVAIVANWVREWIDEQKVAGTA